MRVLFDQATPVPIRPFLTGHTVSTAAHEGWDQLQNGELLNSAEAAGFDVFLNNRQKHPASAKPHRPKDCDCDHTKTAMARFKVSVR
jgi:hypothetical protein